MQRAYKDSRGGARTTLSEAVAYYEENTPKGEFVLVIGGKSDSGEEHVFTLEDAVSIARESVKNGMKATQACKEAAELTGFKKSDIYAALV